MADSKLKDIGEGIAGAAIPAPGGRGQHPLTSQSA